jgi:hypothetical protein
MIGVGNFLENIIDLDYDDLNMQILLPGVSLFFVKDK